MKNWTIRQRVLLSFALILALMAVMGAVALQRLSGIARLAEDVEQTSLPGLHLSSQLMTVTQRRYALVHEHVISNDDGLMRQVESSLQEKRGELVPLLAEYARTLNAEQDKQLFARLEAALPAYEPLEQKVVQLSSARRDEDAHATSSKELSPAFERIQRAAQDLFDYNGARAAEASQQTGAAVQTAVVGVIASGLLALLLGVLSGYVLLRAITTPLAKLGEAVEVMRTGDLSHRLTLLQRDEFAALSDGFNRMSDELGELVSHIQNSGIQVNTSTTELAASSKQQQATATEIAATTTEIGATSREISATSRELVKTMTEVADVAEQSAVLAGNGQAGLMQMEATMRRVMEATGAIHAKLAVLNEKAANIGQVVTTISRVADQTNLLSLNAAIEAEKAGEYGRGFAVVATEIRRLADQTAVATSDIEQMVKEMQSAVSAGVMGMDRFSEEVRSGMHEVQQVGAQLSQIIQQVQALAPRCEAVNEGMQAQSTGAEQITEALGQLSEAAQQTVDSLRQSTIAVADLNHVASSLRTAISRFKLAA